MIYVHIITYNLIPKTDPRERHMEPENSNQGLITKYSAPKDEERCSKNKKKKQKKLEVSGNSIIIAEEMSDHDVGHEINGSVRNGKLTQFDASWG